MIKSTIARSKRFYHYQKERFPILILGLSFLPAVLSSGVIVSSHLTYLQIILVLCGALAYLLHIRITDEYRDFDHDNIHHKTRALQSGVISKAELWWADCVAVAALLIIAVVAGQTAFVVAVCMVFYSYAAGRDFFFQARIRQHFFLYNTANLVQMLLLQVFIYTVFSNLIALNPLIIIHFIFTSIGTIVFEFVRKLKIPGDDGTGRDTYTWYMGFKTAMLAYLILVFVDVALFYLIVAMLLPQDVFALVATASAAALLAIAVFVHWMKKSRHTGIAMQGSFLVVYALFNLAIYYFAR